MAGLKNVVRKQGHFIESRGKEVAIGMVLALVGLVLLWDAFDGRGKNLPWPASKLAPW